MTPTSTSVLVISADYKSIVGVIPKTKKIFKDLFFWHVTQLDSLRIKGMYMHLINDIKITIQLQVI